MLYNSAHASTLGDTMAIIAQLDKAKWFFEQHKLQQLYSFFESCLQGVHTKQEYKDGRRIDLDSGIFAMLQTYKLKSYKKAFFETHKKYIDFQLTIYGNECFMVGDSSLFTTRSEYNAQKDVLAYKPQKSAHRVLSSAGCLCIFFPHDVHAGGLEHKSFTANRAYKIVAKVPKGAIQTYF